MPLETVPPTSLPPCIILILAGFHILAPGGGVNALPYFQVVASNGPWFTDPGCACSIALVSTPAGAASGTVFCAAPGVSAAPRNPVTAAAASINWVRYVMVLLPCDFRR